MINNITKLVIVAHPDDEIIFFTQVLFTFTKEIHLVLVTDGNGDGQSKQRINDFKSVVNKLGIHSYECWNFEDNYDLPLSKRQFHENLSKTLKEHSSIVEVYTHGPLGEYGHPHHIQTSKLVHSYKWPLNTKIYHPDLLSIDSTYLLTLDNVQWEESIKIMTTEYLSEYKKFYNLLPIKKTRSYLADKQYVLNVIKYFEQDIEDCSKYELGPYGPYLDILKLMKLKIERPF